MSSTDATLTTALSIQVITHLLYNLQRDGINAETSTSNKNFTSPGKLLSRLAILLSRGEWAKAAVKSKELTVEQCAGFYKESDISLFALEKKNGTIAFLARK